MLPVFSNPRLDVPRTPNRGNTGCSLIVAPAAASASEWAVPLFNADLVVLRVNGF